MMTIKPSCKRRSKKWQVVNKYGVVIATFEELEKAIDFLVNKKYQMN